MSSPEGFVLWPVPLQTPSFHSALTPPPQPAVSVSFPGALQVPHLADFPDAAGWAPSQLKADMFGFCELRNTVVQNVTTEGERKILALYCLQTIVQTASYSEGETTVSCEFIL